MAQSPPDVVAPPPHHPRFPHVDGTRALAVMLVVVVHSAVFGGVLSPSLGGRLLAHLNVGVTIFFVISGFLLYRPFIAHRGGGAAAPSIRDYAKRRFLRIYPAYWVVLTFLILAPGFTGVIGGHWISMYTLTHTLGFSRGPNCSEALTRCGLAQTWSLVVEVTFYLVLPLYAAVVERLTRRFELRAWTISQLALLGGLSAVSVGLSFGVLYPAPLWFAWSVLGNVFWFSLGMALAVTSVARPFSAAPGARRRFFSRGQELCWAAALLLYLALSLVILPPSPFLLSHAQQVFSHIGFGLIALLVVAPAVLGERIDSAPRKLLANRVVAWLGTISYGIFLWHYAFVLKLGSPGAKHSFAVVLGGTLVLSVACAALSYYAVERPLLRLKYHNLGEVFRRRPAPGTLLIGEDGLRRPDAPR